MFIHIGQDDVIESNDVVAIIDRHIVSSSQAIERMINDAKSNQRLTGDRKDAKSIVITDDHIYYSTLSVSTLKKRSSVMTTIENLEDYSDEDNVDDQEVL